MTITAFETPDREVSFSSLIDRALLETVRPTQLLQAIGYMNTVIRECQRRGLFTKDMIEDTITATADPHIWEPSARHRVLRTVRYTNTGIEPKFKRPMRGMMEETAYYYAADNYFVFKGVEINEEIAMANYFWAPRFSYYKRLGVSFNPLANFEVRKAYWHSEEEVWYYLNTEGTAYVLTLGDTVEEAARRKSASFWLINEWQELVIEGTKAKIWNSVGDSRGRAAYGSYKAMQEDLLAGAAFESIDS